MNHLQSMPCSAFWSSRTLLYFRLVRPLSKVAELWLANPTSYLYSSRVSDSGEGSPERGLRMDGQMIDTYHAQTAGPLTSENPPYRFLCSPHQKSTRPSLNYRQGTIFRKSKGQNIPTGKSWKTKFVKTAHRRNAKYAYGPTLTLSLIPLHRRISE